MRDESAVGRAAPFVDPTFRAFLAVRTLSTTDGSQPEIHATRIRKARIAAFRVGDVQSETNFSHGEKELFASVVDSIFRGLFFFRAVYDDRPTTLH